MLGAIIISAVFILIPVSCFVLGIDAGIHFERTREEE